MKNASGGILVRIETLDGMVRWRNVPDLEHRTLCRAGGLSEEITWFDLPKSFLGGSGRGNRKIEGMIHQGNLQSPPIGRVTIVEEREKFSEEDHREMIRRLGWHAA